MPFRLSLHVDLHNAHRLLQQIRARLPEARRRITEQVARETLQRTIPLNPVRTGRSRAAWVRPLEQLGGPIPPGWPGSHPDPAAIHEGTNAGQLQRGDTDTRTDLRITNSVPYVTWLEYGTRFSPPRAMLRRAINAIRNHLPALARTLFDRL